MSLAIIIQNDGVIRELVDLPDGVETINAFSPTTDASIAMVNTDPLSNAAQVVGITSGTATDTYTLIRDSNLNPLRIFIKGGDALDNADLRCLIDWYRHRATSLINTLYTQNVDLETLRTYSEYFGLPFTFPVDPPQEDPTPEPEEDDDLVDEGDQGVLEDEEE